MLQTLRNAWKVTDIRKKLLVTLFILLLYRLGTAIPVPFVNAANFSSTYSGTILEYLNVLSGGSLGMATLFALGISPYITASIVVQLLAVAIPVLQRWSKEGEEGKKKLNNLTRYTTVILAVVTAVGYFFLLDNSGMIVYPGPRWFTAFVIITCYCAGAALVMWLGEKINEHGFGNGISMILFANILSSLPSQLYRMGELVFIGYGHNVDITKYNEVLWGSIALVFVLVLLFIALAMMVFSVYITGSERRIPIQYAKRVVGRKMYGGQSSNLPLKMNMAGVMPVIFASSIVSIPATIAGFFPNSGFANWVSDWFGYTSVIYILLFIVLIFLFSYFYIMISFNPVEVANNIRNQGGSVPGIRPGKPTSDYIKKILNRITLMGAIFLVIISGVPMIVNAITTAFNVSFSSLAFSGTSLLIIVGVALEVVRDLEAQLAMRNYKGFLD